MKTEVNIVQTIITENLYTLGMCLIQVISQNNYCAQDSDRRDVINTYYHCKSILFSYSGFEVNMFCRKTFLSFCINEQFAYSVYKYGHYFAGTRIYMCVLCKLLVYL